ncbi:hypothetical protein [Myroides sp. LJL119]
MKPIFQENQRFNQWWLWLIILGVCSISLIGFFNQVYLTNPLESKSQKNFELIIPLVISICVLILFYCMRLKTQITLKSISFCFFPFIKRSYCFNDIESYQVIKYGFVGGWGIRFSTIYGTVYNIRGNKGLFVKLKNGNTFVIGTQRAQKLQDALKMISK